MEGMKIRDIWPDAHETSDVELPPKYIVEHDQIFRKVVKDEEVVLVQATTGPLYVAKEMENVDAGPSDINRYRREVRFRANGEWKSFYPWISTLETPKKFSELFAAGIPSDHTIKKETMLYLTEFARYNKMTGKLPVIKTTSISGRVVVDDILYVTHIVYPGGVWDINGPAENPAIVYSAEAIPDSLENIAPQPDGSKEETQRVVEILAKCAEPATAWTMLGWFAAALFAPIIRQVWNEFPILNLYGGKGSGKTSLIRLMSMTFFATASQGSARRPPFSLLREMSATNMFPIILDEYRLHEIKDDHRDTLHHLLRHGHAGGRETRGRPDQTTIDYHLLAPIVLMGESMVEDGAIRERSVILPVSRTVICDHPGAREAYQNLVDLGKYALCRTAGWLWSRSLEVAGGEVAELIMKVRELAEKLQKQYPNLPDRIIHSMAIVETGAKWLTKILEIKEEKIPVEDIRKKFIATQTMEETPTAAFIRYLELENSKRPRDKKVPMRLDIENAQLVLHQVAAVEGYAAYARQMKLPFLGRDALLKELVETGICNGISVIRKMGEKTARCMILDAEKITAKYGVPLDSWPETWPVEKLKIEKGDDDLPPFPGDDDIPF